MGLVELGVGRKRTNDPVDHHAGIEFHVYDGQSVERGQTLFTVFNSTGQGFDECRSFVEKSFEIGAKQENGKLITRILV